MIEPDLHASPSAPTSLLFDWRLDVERLEREVDAAAAEGHADPLCVAEVECSLDLIDAEIVALRAKTEGSVERTAQSLLVLERWRARLQRLIERLRRLKRPQ